MSLKLSIKEDQSCSIGDLTLTIQNIVKVPDNKKLATTDVLISGNGKDRTFRSLRIGNEITIAENVRVTLANFQGRSAALVLDLPDDVQVRRIK